MRTLLILFTFVSTTSALWGDDVLSEPVVALQQRVIDLTARAESVVVGIARIVPSAEVPLPVDFDPFANLSATGQPGPVIDGFGSGVVIRVEDRTRLYILTNHHVITSGVGGTPAEPELLYVRTIGGHTLPATIHAYDPRSDLAVLTASLAGIAAETLHVDPLPLGEGESLRKGQFVLALGNPLAIAHDGSCSVSWGLIGNLSRRPAPLPDQDAVNSSATIHQLGTLLQLDMRLPIGMSGAAIVNLNGEFVGLTTSLATSANDPAPGGFAIPFNQGIRRAIDSLLQGEEVEYGFLGIDPEDSYADELNEVRPFVTQSRCARVSRVSSASPAAEAGIREGDLIYQVQSELIHDRTDLLRAIGLAGPGTETTLSIYRPATRQYLSLTATLGKWPLYDDRRLIVSSLKYPVWRGISVDYATGRFRYLNDGFLATYPNGVIVTNVAANSAAARAGLQPGMLVVQVNERPVSTPQTFLELVNDREGTVALTLQTGTILQVPTE